MNQMKTLIVLVSLFIATSALAQEAIVKDELEKSALVLTDSIGSYLSVFPLEVRFYYRIAVKAVGIDFIHRSIQIIGFYRNAEGKEDNFGGFTIDVPAQDFVSTLAVIGQPEKLLEVVAAKRGMRILQLDGMEQRKL